MTLRVAALASALLLSAACDGGGRGARASVQTRDSAGVGIVENRGSPPALGWTVDTVPLVSIGGDGAAGGPLFQVTDALRMPDGGIVVASAGTQQVRFYGTDGTLLRAVGRAGEGPGEFRAPFWLGRLRGDSVAVWDAGLRRFSVLSPTGDFGRAIQPSGLSGVFPQVIGVLPDDRFVVASAAGAQALPSPGQPRRDTAAFVVVDAAGAVADTLGVFAGTEMVAMGTPATGFVLRPRPFGRQTVTAVRDNRLYVATGDTYQVAVHEPGRGLRALYRAEREPVPVTREDQEAYRRSLVTLGGNAQAKAQSDRLLDEVPFPDQMPPLTAMKVDSAGNLWLQDPQPPGDDAPSTWTVLDPAGRVLGRVRLPSDLSVRQIGGDWVLGVVVDADQVEHVRLYRLTRG
ncbi:hypothetical protein [Longimicrobium sp.]|uniref:hypothetical protein n=1 Tax=Longimicrobium sp. TaxID=2029185 RepID=UPI002E341895|nr:hypothetical protein [Longimicrobium sp.]HEX6036449.1 hypothetical protein [Longimicrobium sp.]